MKLAYKKKSMKEFQVYGGIDGIIETIKGLVGSGETIYKNAFLSAVIWHLEEYKKLKEENKKLKEEVRFYKRQSDSAWDSWENDNLIGERHEMGG